MERVYISDLKDHIGGEVVIFGFVKARRDQGKMVFFDFRDMTSSVQGVVLPKSGAIEVAREARVESAVRVSGIINQRPEKMVSADKDNGDIELLVDEIEILSMAEPLPFEVDQDTRIVDENVRLKYRYLDMRSERMQKNLRLRSEWIDRCRQFLFKNKFTEIETPILAAPTKEGSRDFVVPSRLMPGHFYALPQSPQQYKQLLMAGGYERYFQVARAMRDEDLRADRTFEHTQLDIEMSFVSMEQFMDMMERMMTETVEAMGYVVKEKPWPRFTYKEAMEKYGADKFDLRTEEEKEAGNVLAFAWVHRFPFFEKTSDIDDATAKGEWTFTHNPFSMPIPEHIDWLLKGENIAEIMTQQYDMVCNGFESGGGSVRAHRPEILFATYKAMGYSDDEIEESVGHMIEAFKYGAPPHGGIAIGVDRVIMNMTGEENLREVQAFPMTRSGKTAVMDAPIVLPEEQLKELKINIEKKG